MVDLYEVERACDRCKTSKEPITLALDTKIKKDRTGRPREDHWVG